MKRFSVHFTVQTPLQNVFLNSLENCRSPSKMKPCTISGPEISKKYYRTVIYKMLTIN
jgi:hypothetical protein